MDTFKSGSPHNQLSKIKVKSSNSRVVAAENGAVEQDFDFYYGFRPLYLFSRLTGLMPFTIVQGANGTILSVQVSVFDWIWFFTAITTNTALAIISTKNLRLPQDHNESLAINVGDHLILIVGLILGSFSIAMDMFNRRKLTELAQKYEIFDNEVSVSPHRWYII